MLTTAYIDDLAIHGGGNGLGLIGTDLGSPSPRVVADLRPTQHGATDRTVLYNARSLELRGSVAADTKAGVWALLDDLKGSLALGSMHVLKFTREGESEVLRTEFRVDGPVLVGLSAGQVAPYLDWSVAIFCPDPRLYSDTVSSASYDPTDTGEGGLTFSLDFDLVFEGDGTATLDVVNEGNIATPPTLTITGPVVNPKVTNETTGEAIQTTGLELDTDETIVLDVAARQAYLGGTTSRPDLVDISTTTWFDLAPGTNQLRLTGSGMSATETELAVEWRSARI